MGDSLASEQLALQGGVEYRSVRLELTSEGLDLSALDMGPTVEATWGDDDYEFGVRIKTADLPKLAYALIADRYRGRQDAVDCIRELATRAGIEPNFWSWA